MKKYLLLSTIFFTIPLIAMESPTPNNNPLKKNRALEVIKNPYQEKYTPVTTQKPTQLSPRETGLLLYRTVQLFIQ